MRIGQQHFTTIWPSATGQTRSVHIIDQTRLPHAFEIVRIHGLVQMVQAIGNMQVRGAPLIGAAAAYGMALAAQDDICIERNQSDAYLRQSAAQLLASRPTAVNLRWAVERMLGALIGLPLEQRNPAAWQEAAAICEEDVIINRSIGAHGLQVIQQHMAVTRTVGSSASTRVFSQTQPYNILTHCNAGWLAAVDWGTALAPVYAAYAAGIALHVWVDETRPRNQGASLTAWELAQHGIPYTVITDNAGGHLMQHGKVDMVIVGADRVTSSGDVCNKIGTYLKALAAYDNNIPFYAAVPSPTIDWGICDGVSEIEIEERSADEVRRMTGRLIQDGVASEHSATVSILAEDSPVFNPAFDVTPARLVTGIITERGLCTPANLKDLFHAAA